jgi:hypothetical protein
MAAESADDFRKKAEQCRRLAMHIMSRSDPMKANLLVLAVEFEERSRELEQSSHRESHQRDHDR